MDYLNASLSFKIKKALRYCRLYGISRTLVKVQGQVHMKKRYTELPPVKTQVSERQTIGLIGCGNYAFSNIAYYLNKRCGSVVRGVMDADIHRAASLFEKYSATYYTDDAEQIISDDSIDMIYIASNHASHAEYAICALNADKNVYIEKPHVVSQDQLDRLTAAMKSSSGKVFLGFNRPTSRLGTLARKYLANEDGAGMYNWFVAGHAIDPEHWYFKPEEGGRVLGNLCHWTDFVLSLASDDMYPIEINPTVAAKSDCDIAVSYKFSDGTIAVITFSAKGHTFEGVREKFTAHRGNCLLSLDDFHTLKVEVVDKVHVFKNRHRDHGHENNILNAYNNVTQNQPYDKRESIARVWNTGTLFLKTKETLERNERVVVHAYVGD